MKKFLAMALAAVMVLGVAGCGSSSDEKTEENTENTEQTGETTEGTDGVIKMGVSADFPPFESYADDAVTFVGFDIDLMQEICNRLGMELQIKDMNFDAIVTAVQTGKLDVGVSGITITDERKESVAFSDPYFVASQSILVPKDSPITSYEDLVNGDYTAGVQLGTTGDIMASEKISGRVSQYEKYGDALAALLAGKNDCMVLDTGVADAFAAANDLVVVGTFGEATDSENYGIAIAKENTELLEKVNGALAEMKEDGFIDELTAKYFE
ncbi:MAG: transporter substrate-binding domain-containing protein [Christensenellales bacterium]|jgi:ABC-type amino acid transport substrate-binding protein